MSAMTFAPAPSRLGVAALIVALAAAACGGSTPSASPTASPTIAPTPTPFDVSAAFLEIITDPDFSARMEVDGTMEMGVSATLSGTITGSGDDARSIFKIDVAGTTIETEEITSGGKSYARTSPGPWLEVPAQPGSTDDENLTAWLRTLDQVEDLGVVTKNGQQLHHLSAGDEPVPPGALGLDASTFTDPEVTIDFYAEDDGTPSVFAIEGTWVQLVNGTNINVEFVMDLTISNVGSPIAINPPDDVWTTYESPLGYTMAHPVAFKVENRDGYDAYVGDGVDYIYVVTWPDAAGLNPEGFRDGILASVKDAWGDPIAPPVASPLGGEPGYLASFQYTYDDGSEGIAFDALAMHNNVGWDVTLFSIPGQEVADLALLQEFLATFAYSE